MHQPSYLPTQRSHFQDHPFGCRASKKSRRRLLKFLCSANPKNVRALRTFFIRQKSRPSALLSNASTPSALSRGRSPLVAAPPRCVLCALCVKVETGHGCRSARFVSIRVHSWLNNRCDGGQPGGEFIPDLRGNHVHGLGP